MKFALQYAVVVRHGIFTLPIRNWNFFKASFTKIWKRHFYSTYKELKWEPLPEIPIGTSYFYSTYKELKFRFIVLKQNHLINFYSTYKELKFLFNTKKEDVTKDFYSTYKELKSIYAKKWEDGEGIFTLPIRNWNWGF